jgi:hypothetical protein
MNGVINSSRRFLMLSVWLVVLWSAISPVSAETEASWDAAAIRASWTPVPGEAGAKALPAVPAGWLISEQQGRVLRFLSHPDLKELHRITLSQALVGSPRFSADGRYAYWFSADGWVNRYDLLRLRPLERVRVGLEISDIQLSAQGDHIAVANRSPHSLVILDAELRLLQWLPAQDKSGALSAPVTGLFHAPARSSFVAVMENLLELWEVSYDPQAAEIPAGMIHDFLFREGMFVPGYLHPRRSRLEAPLQAARLVADGHELLAQAVNETAMQVIHLDVRRQILTVPLARPVQWSGGLAWQAEEGNFAAFLNAGEPGLRVFGGRHWQSVTELATLTPGAFMSHSPGQQWLWVATVPGPGQPARLLRIDTGELNLISETALPDAAVVRQLSHSSDGQFLAVTTELALLLLEAATGRTISRLPLDGPAHSYALPQAGEGGSQ